MINLLLNKSNQFSVENPIVCPLSKINYFKLINAIDSLLQNRYAAIFKENLKTLSLLRSVIPNTQIVFPIRHFVFTLKKLFINFDINGAIISSTPHKKNVLCFNFDLEWFLNILLHEQTIFFFILGSLIFFSVYFQLSTYK